MKLDLYLVRVIIISLIFSIIFVSIPWLKFNLGYNDLDTFRYIDYLDSGHVESQLKYNFGSFFSYFFGEWLWLKLQVLFIDLGGESNFLFLKLLPFINIFCVSVFLLKNTKFYYLPLILYPISLMFYFGQLRLSVAMSIFLLVFCLFDKKLIRILTIIAVCLIHASMIMFLSVFYALYKVNNFKLKLWVKLLFVSLLSLSFVMVNSGYLSAILNMFGSSRGDYYNDFELGFSTSTTLYFLILMIVFVFIIYYRKIEFNFYHIVTFFILITLIFCYFFDHTYPSRYLAVFYPFVLVSTYQLKSILFLGMIVFLVAYTAFVDLNIPSIFNTIF